MRAEFDLALTDPIGRVDDLALEIADVHDVEIDDADRPDARRREVQGSRRAEAACTDEQRLRPEQFRLALGPDLGDEQVPAVALLLLGRQEYRRLEVVPGALPGLEPAGHRCDVRVAHPGEGLGREQRANAAGAIQDHRRVTIGDGPLDLLLDVALGDVACPGQVALVPLGILANVDERGGIGGQGFDLLRGDLADLGARLAEEVCV